MTSLVRSHVAAQRLGCWRHAGARALAVAAAVVVFMGPASAGQAQGTARPTNPPNTSQLVETFLGDLQDAVGRHDRQAVAAMVRYPATVLVSGYQVPVSNAAAFVKLYDAVFTAELEDVIALSGMARAGRQAPKYPIRTTADGMTIGKGLLWVQRVGTGLKIARIIVPASSPDRLLHHSPIRVIFYAGQPSAQFSGLLTERDEFQPYVVSAMKGRVLEAKIDRFPGRDAIVRVVDQQSGNPLEARSRDGSRTWTGVIPETAEYRIEVVRLAPTTGAPLSYTLAVTLR